MKGSSPQEPPGDEITILRAGWKLWVEELRGPVHGSIQTIRGMCTDRRAHSTIDTALAELDDQIYKLRCAIEFPIGKPTEADFERAQQLAKEHGW